MSAPWLLSWALAGTSSIAGPPPPPIVEPRSLEPAREPGNGPRPIDELPSAPIPAAPSAFDFAEPQTSKPAAKRIARDGYERSVSRLGAEITELFNPGAKDGGVFIGHSFDLRGHFGFLSGMMRLDASLAGAVATPLGTDDSSTTVLGNPQAVLSFGRMIGSLFGRAGFGINFPLSELGKKDRRSYVTLALATADGTAAAPRWGVGSLALAFELGVDPGHWWTSLRFDTALVPSHLKFGGDLRAEAGIELSDGVALGAALALAYYDLPRDRVVRVCVADDPSLCESGGGPVPFNERFELKDAIIRAEPFVTIDLGPELRISWTFLVESLERESQLYGRHQVSASLFFPI